MMTKITQIKNHCIVCGFGRVGRRVAEVFRASGVPFIVVDDNEESVGEPEERGIPKVTGDATANEVLIRAGIERAKALIACSDSDVSNVSITLSARSLNPHLHIVARAARRDAEEKLVIAGANRVISPYFIAGIRMAAFAMHPVISDFLELVAHGGHLEFKLHEISIGEDSRLAGKTLKEGAIRDLSGALVLAIQRADGSFDLQPQASSLIKKEDTLVVIGTDEQMRALEALVAQREAVTR